MKNLVIVVLAVAVGVLIYLHFIKKPDASESTKPPVALKQEIIKKYQDSLTHENHTAFTDKNRNLPKQALSDGTISKPLLDTISKALDIKSSQVVSYQKISLVSEAKALKAEKRADSLQRIVYTYSTKYIDLSFTEPDSLHKVGEFGYKYRTDIKTVQYNPLRVLGIPVGRDIIDISSTDKNATINGLEAFSIRPTDRFFGAELQALGQYNVFDKGMSYGVGGQIRLGRVYITGSEYYNINQQRYRTLIGTRVAIFKY
jgi:hypothetical protein